MKKYYLLIFLFSLLGRGVLYAQLEMADKSKCNVKASATASQDSICQGYSDTLSAAASGGTAPYTYSWAPDTGLSCNNCPNPIATPTSTTTYTVTVTDKKGCSATAKVKVKVDKPPVFNANANLALLLLGDSMHATGGDPPYTYNWAPPISSSLLLSLPTSPTNYTLTVTGANGCSSTDIATYIPAPNKTAACGSIFIDQYIQDTLNHDDAIELYNPTPSNISLDDYYLFGTTNGSLYAPPFIIRLHGTIKAYKTFLIANTLADSALTHKAKMLSDSLNFGGKDIVSLANMTVVSSHVSIQALDALGAISPLPTDSGWAVSTGSTKNHTLIRQAIVTQGDISWPSCQLQWNVYAQGTFTHIGNYNNVCTPKDAKLYLTLVNDSVVCGTPSYFTFDIMAQADSAKIFNDCELAFNYPLNEFLGVNGNGDGIYIEPGPNFQYNSPSNDYQIAIGPYPYPSDSGIEIDFGSSSFQSPQGTVIDTIPQVLLHVRLVITNSCHTGTIHFTGTSHFANLSHFVNEDSTFLHKDSTVVDSLAITNPHCPYQCDTFPCNKHCCDVGDTDAYGNCIDSCWDICYNICYNTCYDTIKVVHYYNVYSYSNYHNVQYSDTYYSDSIPTSSCPPVVTNFNDTIRAGIGDTLTIWGANFGNTRGTGQVKFYDADTANYYIQRLNDVDYLKWQNNEIKIKLPAFADSVLPTNLQKELTIGGNKFWVVNSCGDSAASGNNSYGNPFSVYYNLNQAWDSHYPSAQKTEILLRSTDTNRGYTMRFDSVTFPKGSIQRAIFYKAMRDWTCFTGMNWIVGKDTSYKYNIGSFSPGLNYVFFTDSLLLSNIVAETYPNPDYCHNYTDILSEGVIAFNSHINFTYDTTELVAIPSGQEDFYGVCLHELGHFIGLEHSTVPTSLMYWTANKGPIAVANRITLYTPAAGTATDGGSYSVHQGENITSDCLSVSTMQGKATSCVNEYSAIKQIISQNNTNFIVYPNPSNGTFTIDANVNDYALVVMNMLGQVILSKKINEEKTVISLSNVANGMYFLQEHYKNGVSSQKIIITKK